MFLFRLIPVPFPAFKSVSLSLKFFLLILRKNVFYYESYLKNVKCDRNRMEWSGAVGGGCEFGLKVEFKNGLFTEKKKLKECIFNIFEGRATLIILLL